MTALPPAVLTIAGMDPSGGAGLFADMRVFDSLGLRGKGVCTGLTIQNSSEFHSVAWTENELLSRQLKIVLVEETIVAVKLGLIQNLNMLQKVKAILLDGAKRKLVWDPVLSASAGFVFQNSINQMELKALCRDLALITPNRPEMETLLGGRSAESGAEELSQICPVLLKDGHGSGNQSVDRLYVDGKKTSQFESPRFTDVNKRGTGCAFSSAVVGGLALGDSLEKACNRAKEVMAGWLSGEGNYGVLRK